MKKSFVLAAVLALALPMGTAAIAADSDQTPPANHKTEKSNVVHGTITKIDGQTLTVDGKEVKLTDKTEIMQGKKTVTADALKVGEKISARIKDGVATRIEIQGKHTGEKEHSEAK